MKALSSKLIHGQKKDPQDPHGTLKTPIYNSSAFEAPNAEYMEQSFRGLTGAHTYSRISNPTVSALENRLCDLSGAERALCLSSGMAAINAVLTAILSSGERVLTAPWLFGNTVSLLNNTLTPFGVSTDFVDLRDLDQVEKAITKDTRCLLVEGLSNPQLILHDLEGLADICERHNLIFIVDNSLTTPYLCPAGELKADVEVLSTTKSISGGATGIGGAILFYPSKKWKFVPKLEKDYDQWGPMALQERIFREIYRNQGACMAPQNAWLQLLGLETLTLRLDRAQENALKVARFLEDQALVEKVVYPGLESYPYKNLLDKTLKGNHGQMILFDMSSQEQCYQLLDALKMIRRATNFCDNKSLIIHPASTIYSSFSEEDILKMEFSLKSIRLSVGIEDSQDIVEDLEQALRTIL